jgi:hypothetical protein
MNKTKLDFKTAVNIFRGYNKSTVKHIAIQTDEGIGFETDLPLMLRATSAGIVLASVKHIEMTLSFKYVKLITIHKSYDGFDMTIVNQDSTYLITLPYEEYDSVEDLVAELGY